MFWNAFVAAREARWNSPQCKSDDKTTELRVSTKRKAARCAESELVDLRASDGALAADFAGQHLDLAMDELLVAALLGAFEFF